MLKVNNKDTRTYFLPYSSVFIVNFEHVIAGWDPCNFNEILSIIDSNSLLFENTFDKRRKRKLILVKIDMTMLIFSCKIT